MALSSKWSQAVVVRADQGEVVVAPPSSALPSSSSARAYAAAGNPIVIRARDSNHILCRTDAEQSTQRNGGGLHAWLTVGTRDVVGCTFWVPEGTQMGLLETLYRKGAANTLPTLLQSRPLEELQYNFSTCTGQNIDLSHNAFRLSKTAMALHNMDAALGEDDSGEDGAADVGDGSFGGGSPTYGQQGPVARTASRSRAPASRISMTTREFKQSLRCSLQSLQEEDYYVVKYRDYSTWAVTEYSSLTKSDRFLGKKYVEQCFAVHVGREPGELLPITESQFLFAVDLLQRQLMNQLTSLPAPSSATGAHDVNRRTYEQYQLDINYCALNVDQFKSLWAILGEGLRTVHVEGEEQKRSQQLKQTEDAVRQQNLFGNAWSADPLYKAPAWYDWRPSAVRMRVQHQMTLYYTSVGRFTVQLLLLGCCGYLIYRTAAPHLSHAFGGASADKRKRSGSRGGYDDYDDDFAYPRRRPGFLRSALMGPKDMLDYLLAPAEV